VNRQKLREGGPLIACGRRCGDTWSPGEGLRDEGEEMNDERGGRIRTLEVILQSCKEGSKRQKVKEGKGKGKGNSEAKATQSSKGNTVKQRLYSQAKTGNTGTVQAEQHRQAKY
jgi:hypothetical protein